MAQQPVGDGAGMPDGTPVDTPRDARNHTQDQTRVVAAIVAASEDGVIGVAGGLPWDLPDDLRHFMRTTMGCPVIMGRRTFDSMPGVLRGRTVIVVTGSAGWSREGVARAGSIAEALALASAAPSRTGEVFIGGGETVYREAAGLTRRVYLTRVHARVAGDTRFPIVMDAGWRLAGAWHRARDERHVHAFTVERYERIG